MGAIDGAPKEIRRLLIHAQRAGATVTMGGGGHYKVSGEGWVVTISQTPRSVENCVRNATKDLRRKGLRI